MVKKNGEKEKLFSFDKNKVGKEDFEETNEDDKIGERKIFYDYFKKRREIGIKGINYFLNYINYYIKGYN